MNIKTKKCFFLVLSIAFLVGIFSFGFISTPVTAEDNIVSNIQFDKETCQPGDTLSVSLVLSNIPDGAKTNSAEFKIEYNSEIFELATGDESIDIANTYITFTIKKDSNGTITASYIDMYNDVALQENQAVVTISFKVKETAVEGQYDFNYIPTPLVDSSSKTYGVIGITDTVQVQLPPELTTITIDGSNFPENFKEGDTYDLSQLTLYGFDQHGQAYDISGAEITWNSSDTDVASVSGSTLTAKSFGNTTITASVGQVTSEGFEVTVEPVLASLTITPNPAILGVDDNLQLNISGTMTDGSDAGQLTNITWSTDDPAVASVSQTGELSGVTIGETVVRAEIGSIEGTATVFVVSVPTPNANYANNSNFYTSDPINVSFGNVDLTQYDVRYTLDGTDINAVTDGNEYTADGISITPVAGQVVTLKARAFSKEGQVPGGTAVYTYSFRSFAGEIAASEDAEVEHTCDISVELSLTEDNPGTEIQYKLGDDGTWETYTEAIHLLDPATILDAATSDVYSFTYVFDNVYLAIREAFTSLQKLASLNDAQLDFLLAKADEMADLGLFPDVEAKLENKGVTVEDLHSIITAINENFVDSDGSGYDEFRTDVENEDYGDLFVTASSIQSSFPTEIRDALDRRGISEMDLMITALDILKSGLDFFTVNEELKTAVNNIFAQRFEQEDKEWLSSYGINYDNLRTFIDSLDAQEELMLKSILEGMNEEYVAAPIIELADGTYVGTQYVSITASSGTVKYLLYEEEQQVTSEEIWNKGSVYSRSIPLASQSGQVKTYYLYAVAGNEQGNLSSVAEGRYTILAEQIQLTLTAPEDNIYTLNDQVAVSGTTLPNADVIISVGGTNYTVQADAAGSFTTDVDLAYGSNTITAVAEAYGMQSAEAVRTVYYDNVAPTINLSSLKSPTQIPMISIKGDYTEDYIEKIEITINDGEPLTAGLNTTANTFIKNYLLQADGEYSIRATIYDKAGNSAVSNTVIVLLDRQAPDITEVVITPQKQANDVINAEFVATITENSAIDENKIKVYINDKLFKINNLLTADNGDGTWTVEGMVNNVPAQENGFKLEVTDIVGLTGSYEGQFQADLIPPTSWATIDKAADDKGINNWYQIKPVITIYANEGTIYYQVNSGSQNEGGTSPVTVDNNLLTEGENTIEYWAEDEAGNEEVHNTISLSVDTVDPAAPVISEGGISTDIPGKQYNPNLSKTNASQISINGTVEDGVEKVVLSRVNRGGNLVSVANTAVNDGSFSFSGIKLVSSQTDYQLTAVDASGRVSEATTFTIYRDLAGPIFTIELDQDNSQLTIQSSEAIDGNITVTSNHAEFAGEHSLDADNKVIISYYEDLPGELTVSVSGQDLIGNPGQGALTVTTITAADGGVIDTGKAFVSIPAGALPEDTTVEIKSTVAPKEPPQGYEDLGGTTSFEAGAGNFKAQVEAHIYITWVEGINLEGVQLYYYDETNEEWIPVDEFTASYEEDNDGDGTWEAYPQGQEPQVGDTARINISFNTDHFSIWTGLVRTTGPEINITSPVNGFTTKNDTVTVIGTTEEGSKVEVSVSGTTTVLTESTPEDGSFSGSVNIAEGENEITVTATKAGAATTSVISVISDQTAPALNLDQGNMITRNDHIVISGDTGDEQAEVKIYLDNTLQGTVVADAQNQFSFPVDLAQGDNEIRVEAIDNVGNSTEKTITVTLDNENPVLSIVASSVPEYTSENNITITGTTDNNVKLTITNNGNAVVTDKDIADGNISEAVALEQNDSNSIIITVEDNAGNISSVTYVVNHDDIPPVISVNPLSSATTTSQTVSITGQSESGCSIWVKVNNGEWLEKGSVDSNGNFNVAAALELIDNTDTVNNIKVRAEDQAGNRSSEVDLTITRQRATTSGPGSGAHPIIRGPQTQEGEYTPGESTTVETEDNKFKITMPEGAAEVSATVAVTEVAEDDQIDPGPGTVLIGNKQYQIEVKDEEDNNIRQFAEFLILEFRYEDDDIPVDTEEEELRVFYWDDNAINPATGEEGAWIAVPTTVDKDNNKVTARTNHLTVYALMSAPDFPEMEDISGHWAEMDILKIVSLQIANGDPSGDFRPNDNITRQEFAKIVVLSAGLQPVENPDFQFVDANDISEWARGYVAAAVDAGIITGYEDNTFKAKQDISRAELATMVIRALHEDEVEQPELSFNDADSIPAWAAGFVAKAVEYGIINGFPDGTFRAGDNATRAESAKMISKMLNVRIAD